MSHTRDRGAGAASRPATGGRSIRTGSLFFLVVVVGIVALLMALSLVGFVVKPDPAVRAGPMYVTLALITGASLLMLVLSLNATFLPLMSRRQVPTSSSSCGRWASPASSRACSRSDGRPART
jgi:hypothetical protein